MPVPAGSPVVAGRMAPLFWKSETGEGWVPACAEMKGWKAAVVEADQPAPCNEITESS
jgi:hypothetical protein